MRVAARKYHDRLIIANSNNSVVTESQNVTTLLDDHPAAMIIAPINSQSSVPAVNRVISAGVPVVDFSNTIDDSRVATYVGVSNEAYGEAMGKQAATYISDHMRGKAKIGTLLQPGFEIVTHRVDGFEKELVHLPDTHVVSTGAYNGTESSAYNAIVDMLTGNPSINVIYAPNEGATDAAISAIKALHDNNKVILMGLDVDKVSEAALLSQSSPLKLMVTQNPYRIGYDTVKLATDLADHHAVPKKLIVPFNVLTKSNVKAYVRQYPIPS